MTKPKYFLFSTFVLAAAIGACGPSGEGGSNQSKTKVIANTAKSPYDLLPLSVGNSWTYQYYQVQVDAKGQRTESTAISTLKVVSVKDAQGGKEAVVRVYQGGEATSEIGFLVNDKGVFQTYHKGKEMMPYNPALLLMSWPVKAGQVINWTGTGLMPGPAKMGKIDLTVTCRGEMEVDTLTGRMKAIRTDGVETYSYQGKKMQTTMSMWFEPRIGIIRTLDVFQFGAAGRQAELKLKSYTVK